MTLYIIFKLCVVSYNLTFYLNDATHLKEKEKKREDMIKLLIRKSDYTNFSW